MRITNAVITIFLLFFAILCGINYSTLSTASPSSPHSTSDYLTIDEVNIEAEKQDHFISLDEFITESPLPTETISLPQLLNDSHIRINTSFSTVIGNPESIIVRKYAVDVYVVIAGESDNFTKTIVEKEYRFEDPVDLKLSPNSSRSEIFFIPSLDLPSYGIFKFVFRVEFHVTENIDEIQTSLFPQNTTFELVRSYPNPPYIILYLFYFVVFGFIAVLALGVYGNRKYQKE
ncbi:MAG: hypothetical protein ACXAC8_19095 [Candidatus Hodarchaeales archaeon]|jgi:hypothetical protein